MALANLSIYYTWKNIKSAYHNNKSKISAPTWNDEFHLPDWSYSTSNIQDYFEFVITLTENPPLQTYSNKIKNRIVFKIKNRIVFEIKTGYKLELLSPETMTLLGSTNKYVDQDKDGEDVPKLESVEVILVHCNLVNSNYELAPKFLFTFVTNKQFGQLINVSPHSLTVLKNKDRIFFHWNMGYWSK